MIHDVRLLAGDQRLVAVVVEDKRVVAVHFPSDRVEVGELEELMSRINDGDFIEGDES